MLKIAIKNEPDKTEERQIFLNFLKDRYGLTDIDYSGVATTLFIEEKMRRIIEELFVMAAELLHISKEQILNKNRKPANVVFARDVLCIVLRCRYDMSYPEIGKWLKFSNHTGVMFSCRKFYTDDDEELKELYKELSLTEIFDDAERRRKRIKSEKRQNTKTSIRV